MKPIAVFYHGCFVGHHRNIDIRFACWLMRQQMAAMNDSGLTDAATEIHICINGDESDIDVAKLYAPTKSQFHQNGHQANSEIPTMNILHRWAKSHPDWYVLYTHAKGLSHPEQPNTRWRLKMEEHVIWNWQTCCYDLDRGFDCCGSYWLTPEEHRNVIKSPFYGGTMWFAKSDYVAQLRPLPDDTFDNRYAAEGFIGDSPRIPRVQIYEHGWPPQQ